MENAANFIKPEQIIAQFNLNKGDHIADFGAGHGYFTIPMAHIVGENGKVYAFDIQKSVLDIIRSRAQLEHLLNIEPVWADLEARGGSHLQDGVLDFALIANALFQFDDRAALLAEAFRILRSSGRMAIIEWDQSPSALGPAMNIRIPKDAAESLAAQIGFQPERSFEAGSHHYGVLFVKP